MIEDSPKDIINSKQEIIKGLEAYKTLKISVFEEMIYEKKIRSIKCLKTTIEGLTDCLYLNLIEKHQLKKSIVDGYRHMKREGLSKNEIKKYLMPLLKLIK